MSQFASENKKVKQIRDTLLKELDTTKIFVEWEDQSAKAVKMIIEGESIVPQQYFYSIVGDKLPHDIFSYDTHPADGVRDWAETHIIFHV